MNIPGTENLLLDVICLASNDESRPIDTLLQGIKTSPMNAVPGM